MKVKVEELLQERPVFLIVGVRAFGDSLSEAGSEVVFVDWAPPAGGDRKMAALLDDLL